MDESVFINSVPSAYEKRQVEMLFSILLGETGTRAEKNALLRILKRRERTLINSSITDRLGTSMIAYARSNISNSRAIELSGALTPHSEFVTASTSF